MTCTPGPVNRPAKTRSIEAAPLGDVGDDDPPPQAENSVASVAPEATSQAPAQNRRRETVFVSDIAEILVRAAVLPEGRVGKIEATRKRPGFPESAVPGGFPPITDWGGERVNL